ncbi:MAG: hypothetical protein C0490_12330, partial [Marivirga sp.]|nr:hypothetical protein [Marivirga sp.]
MFMLEPAFYMTPVIRRIILVVFISGSLGMLFYAYIHFSEKNIFPTPSGNLPGFIVSAFIGFFTGFSLYYTNKVLDKFLAWKNFYATRFLLGYIINYAVALGMTLGLSIACVYLFGPDTFWIGFLTEDEDMKLKVGILLLAMLFIYKVIYALLYSYQQYAVAQLENLQR